VTATEQVVKTLLLMRHAKSSWDNPGQDDHDRPLNPRGLRDAPHMGQLLIDESLVPDSITCSTAVRAHDTARIVAEACGCASPLRVAPELYHADLEAWQRVICGLPVESERALCVGHNPGIEMLLAELTGEFHHMGTAAVACVGLPIEGWPEFTTSKPLRHWMLWRPKDLPDPTAEG
jgi:phosphohistidine phosphatase